MAQTSRQALGELGEVAVTRLSCPRCKRPKTLRRLPTNFKCADIICDFCGYLAQVKTTERPDIENPPRTLLGAAWGVELTGYPSLSDQQLRGSNWTHDHRRNRQR